METSRSAKKCLRWNPSGKRKKGRPKMTWRRSVETSYMTWGDAESKRRGDVMNMCEISTIITCILKHESVKAILYQLSKF